MKKHKSIARKTAPPTFITGAAAATNQSAEVKDAKAAMRAAAKRILDNTFARKRAAEIVAEKEAEVTSLRASSPKEVAGRHDREREDLLATIALGQKNQDDLAAFDAAAEEERRVFAEQSARLEAIKPVEAAIAGLRREIARLDAQKKALETERDAAWRRFLVGLAEADGAEYRAHAEKAFAAMIRVLNFGALLQRLEGTANAIGLGAREFCIPALGVASADIAPESRTELGIETNLFSIASDQNLRRYVEPVEEQILGEFKNAGLEWPGPPSTAAAPARPQKVPSATGTPITIARPAEPLRAGDGSVLSPQTVGSDFDPFGG